MTKNRSDILDAEAVREAREQVRTWELESENAEGGDWAEIRKFFDEDLDAYASAILAEVRTRVEAIVALAEIDTGKTDRDEAISRAAVLALLDGGTDA